MSPWRWPAPYHDDRDLIPDGELLYRRINASWIKSFTDDDVPILDSQSFQDLPESVAHEKGYELRCMSVGVGSLLAKAGGPKAVLQGLSAEEYGIAELTAGCLRRDDTQGIMLAPEGDAPWHAVVFALEKPKRTKAMERLAAKCASWWSIPSELKP